VRKTRFVKGRGDVKLRPWSVDIRWSKAARERFTRALFELRAALTDSGLFADSGLAVVWLLDGDLEKFEEIAKPYGVRHPARVSVGLIGYQCTECHEDCPPGHHGGEEWKGRSR
jgi:hypothetical protein